MSENDQAIFAFAHFVIAQRLLESFWKTVAMAQHLLTSCLLLLLYSLEEIVGPDVNVVLDYCWLSYVSSPPPAGRNLYLVLVSHVDAEIGLLITPIGAQRTGKRLDA